MEICTSESETTLEGGKQEADDCHKVEVLGYQHTLMYGRYSQELSTFARKEAKRIISRSHKQTFPTKFHAVNTDERSKLVRVLSNALALFWNKTFGKFGEDWAHLYLLTLGITMAIISFLMDSSINVCLTAQNLVRGRVFTNYYYQNFCIARRSLYTSLNYHIALQYFSWIILPILMILFSAALVHIVAPQAIGSGIPEMKTILRGVILKDYLSFRTLFAKVIGLVVSLGSGMPLGKEGPFVHIASIVATQLAKLRIFKSIYENQSRGMEMLAAACAVGVACCFAAPVGGVLMSIEVTSVYFAVRDYWRGFFAATFGATFFRLLAVWFQGHETLKPVFKTYLGGEYPYDPLELIIFAAIGVICGLIGALFVFLHRQYVLWMRRNKKLNSFLQKNRFIYPIIISWFIASINFPPGFGMFIAGDLTTHEQVLTLFSNFSWAKENFTSDESLVIQHWKNPSTGIFVNLSLYFITTFFVSILASTLPVPSGNFVPVFKMGAAVGRIAGEVMQLYFPKGIKFSDENWKIVPGAYAIVGAAAVTGAVTRTVSVCVIVVEMTGQISYIIPILIAVLISNAIAGLLQPSIFDSIAIIKRLPYLPDFLPSGTDEPYNILAKDFMVANVHYIYHGMTYKDLKNILRSHPALKAFPLVDSCDSKILLGSVDRSYLLKLIERQISREKKSESFAPKYLNYSAEQKKLVIKSESKINFLPSRFEVVPVVSSDETAGSSTSHESSPKGLQTQRSPRPKKSILKKTLSFNDDSFSNENNLCPSPYQTVIGVESEVRKKVTSVFKRASSVFSERSNQSEIDSTSNLGRKTVRLIFLKPFRTNVHTNDYKQQMVGHNLIRKLDCTHSNQFLYLTALYLGVPVARVVSKPFERVIDMSIEDQIAWEEAEMNKCVDFSRCPVDPLPLNLVGQTTLLKIHSLFSLLRINRAYVTEAGRLNGVVSMRELRMAIEQCNAGSFSPSPTSTMPAQEDEEEDL